MYPLSTAKSEQLFCLVVFKMLEIPISYSVYILELAVSLKQDSKNKAYADLWPYLYIKDHGILGNIACTICQKANKTLLTLFSHVHAYLEKELLPSFTGIAFLLQLPHHNFHIYALDLCDLTGLPTFFVHFYLLLLYP